MKSVSGSVRAFLHEQCRVVMRDSQSCASVKKALVKIVYPVFAHDPKLAELMSEPWIQSVHLLAQVSAFFA